MKIESVPTEIDYHFDGPAGDEPYRKGNKAMKKRQRIEICGRMEFVTSVDLEMSAERGARVTLRTRQGNIILD